VSLALTNGGGVEIDGREGRPGTKLTRGSVLFARGGGACLVVEPAVRTCVEKGTMLRVSDLGPHRRLELLRGRIVAETKRRPLFLVGALHGFDERSPNPSVVPIETAAAAVAAALVLGL